MEKLNYFEAGCLCFLTGKIEKYNGQVEGIDEYYLNNCTCSRHPDSSNRYCWDKDDDRSNPQILSDYLDGKTKKG